MVDAVNSRLGIDLGTCASLWVALLAAPWQAVAQQQPQTVRIDYVNADLSDVIRSLATQLGVNVMLTDVPTRAWVHALERPEGAKGRPGEISKCACTST